MKGELITKEKYLKENASISKKVNNLDLNSPEGKKWIERGVILNKRMEVRSFINIFIKRIMKM